MDYNVKIKTVNCIDDFIKLDIHVGEEVIYKNQHYTFTGISGYKADLSSITNMLRLIPDETIKNNADPYIGKKFMYNGFIVEVLQKNKNGTYSIQAYENGKKHGCKFSILPQDTKNFKAIA